MASLFRLLSATLQHPLNARSWRTRLSALSRVVRWQFGSRLLPEAEFILPFADGAQLAVTRGMVGATGNWYGGLDEPDEMGFLLRVLRDGDLFLDIGANIGSYSILASCVAGVRGMAFEPVPSTFARLARNISLNNAGERITAHQSGVADKPGALRFTTHLDSMNFVAEDDRPESETVSVPVVRLDDVVPGIGRGRLIAKIDVEGFEMAVLDGGAATFGSPDFLAVIMETNGSGERYGISDADLFGRMRDFGFEPYWYSAIAGRLAPAAPGSPAHINTLFLKDVGEVEKRLASAPGFNLVNGVI